MQTKTVFALSSSHIPCLILAAVTSPTPTAHCCNQSSRSSLVFTAWTTQCKPLNRTTKLVLCVLQGASKRQSFNTNIISTHISTTTVCQCFLFSRNIGYRSKSDRWPCHVTLTDKRPKNTLSRMFLTYILGQKVDLFRNVTLSRFRFSLFLNSFFDHIAVFEQFLLSIWAIKLTFQGM